MWYFQMSLIVIPFERTFCHHEHLFQRRLRVFGCLVNKLPPIVANEVKHVSPILNCLGIFSSAVSIIFPKFCQYFIVGMSLIYTVTNVSTNFSNTIIHFSWKIGDPFHRNNFPHMDVVTIDTYFKKTIKLRILWNTQTMDQHWYTSGIEVIRLPTNLVHILYGCFLPSLIKHSLQISSKLRYIWMEESIHDNISGCF